MMYISSIYRGRCRCLTLVLFLLYFLLPFSLQARDRKGHFVVVIDAGHGGKDPGASGSFSKEKNINLQVALKTGSYINSLDKDIVVLYTRKRDFFVGLNERADFANRHKADLFVSIHTNSAGTLNSPARGTEIYVLGLARTKENLAVAMKENAVILKEDNYQTKYAGFDPTSTESYIIFQFLQNKHLEKSIEVAEIINKNFVKASLTNRGVRQAGFLVLRRTSMPSILVELGFITNKREERYMNSSDGINNLGQSIARAIIKYKAKMDERSVSDDNLPKVRASNVPLSGDSSKKKKVQHRAITQSSHKIYRIQIHTDTRRRSSKDRFFRGYRNHFYVYREGGKYKYTLYQFTSLSAARQMRKKLSRNFRGCFIVVFRNGKKIGVVK